MLIETIPEIIANKAYYRGSAAKPRDILDIGSRRLVVGHDHQLRDGAGRSPGQANALAAGGRSHKGEAGEAEPGICRMARPVVRATRCLAFSGNALRALTTGPSCDR
ncbi:hypothetical protein EOA38_27700, partial [Mesorhizobium sp. M1E.F.Ca.ET.041.01.1.1]